MLIGASRGAVAGRTGIAVVVCALALALSACGGGSAVVASASAPTTAGSADTPGGSGSTSVAASTPTSDASASPKPPASLSTTPRPTTARPSAAASSPRSNGQVYDATRNAKADVSAALALARADGKHVLVDFGADWCPDCLVLDRLYRSASVAPLLGQRYHVVTVDIGHGELNRDLSRRYGDVIANGIPALVVLDAHGNVVTTTKDGSFANARTMTPTDVSAFLRRWSGVA